MTKQAADRIRE